MSSGIRRRVNPPRQQISPHGIDGEQHHHAVVWKDAWFVRTDGLKTLALREPLQLRSGQVCLASFNRAAEAPQERRENRATEPKQLGTDPNRGGNHDDVRAGHRQRGAQAGAHMPALRKQKWDWRRQPRTGQGRSHQGCSADRDEEMSAWIVEGQDDAVGAHGGEPDEHDTPPTRRSRKPSAHDPGQGDSEREGEHSACQDHRSP